MDGNYFLYLQAIKKELIQDPDRIGYAGKTMEEQAGLLNKPYIIFVPTLQTAKIAQIIEQIPFAPNFAKTEDVQEALKP